MKSYKAVAHRYLLKKKRRSILTIVGIVLSVALITAIFTMFYSIDASQVEDYKKAGDYHVAFKGITAEKAKIIEARSEVDSFSEICTLGYARAAQLSEDMSSYTGSKNLYLTIDAYGDNAIKSKPYTLLSGRQPQSSGEIAIERWALKQMKPEPAIGSTLSLPLCTEAQDTAVVTATKQYKLVGILKDTQGISSRSVCNAVTVGLPTNEGSYTAFVRINRHINVDKFISTVSAAVYPDPTKARESGLIDSNNRLMSMEGIQGDGTFAKQFIIVGAFLSILIIIATVSVIYNSFQISVLERMNQFGLLRCIGSTPSQIRSIVMQDALIMAVIGIPFGILLGLGAIEGVLWATSFMQNSLAEYIRVHISWVVIVISVLLGVFTVYISALLPARKAGKVSPVEAVTGSGSYSSEIIKKVKKARISRMFGLSGTLARKNLSRNRRRLNVTVFSMAISIVLFIVFYGYVNILLGMNTRYNKIPDYSVILAINAQNNSFSTQDIDAIKKMEGIQNVITVKRYDMGATIKLSAYLDKNAASGMQDSKGDPIVYTDVSSLPDSLFISHGFDPADMAKKHQAAIIQGKNYMSGKATTALKKGDHVLLGTLNEESTAFTHSTDIEVAGEISDLPITFNQFEQPLFFVPESVFAQIDNKSYNVIHIKPAPDADLSALGSRLESFTENKPWIHVTDFAQQAKSTQDIFLQLQIYIYGFIIVIALISSINIINTITTNIILRRRELAMLKAVGMDQGQLRRMISLESIYYGVYAILYGSVIGTGLYFLLTKLSQEMFETNVKPLLQAIAISIVCTLVLVITSALIPLRRLDKQDIMEGIRAVD